jgi:hypothetical protein
MKTQGPSIVTYYLNSLRKTLSRFIGAENGATAMLFALSSPIWVAGLAFSAEVAVWQYYGQKTQHDADTVALGLAGRMLSLPSETELRTLAQVIVPDNTEVYNRIQIDQLRFSETGTAIRNGSTVEVTLGIAVKRYFTKMFMPADFRITRRARARLNTASMGCILGLSTNAARTVDVGAVGTAASGTININGCEVLSNSRDNLGVTLNTAQLNATCARSAWTFNPLGRVKVTCTSTGIPITNAGVTSDPLKDLPEPNLGGLKCTSGPLNISNISQLPEPQTLGDGTIVRYFCHNVSFSGNIPNLPPALYIFKGATFNVAGYGTLATTGSTFYFTGGARPIMATSQATLNITAPTTGTYAGIAMFSSRSTPATSINSLLLDRAYFQGTLYFPSSVLEFRTSGTYASCLQMIANRVRIGGSWTSNVGPCTGAKPIIAVDATAELIE